MRRFLPWILPMILAVTFSLRAAAPPRGADRLRELVVFPEINLNFNFGLRFEGNGWVIIYTADLPEDINQAREALKKQPDDINELLKAANLLGTDGQTNEAQTDYQKAAQLCATRGVNAPQDGLNWTRYGEALAGLGEHEKAEGYYRRGVLVSSNEWRCWTGLGNFLQQQFNSVLFHGLTNSQELISIMTTPDTPDFRPTADNLKRAEALDAEAARCLDTAVALAPQEAEAYLQRGGYQAVAGGQDGLLRHFKNNEPFDTNLWVTGFSSPGLLTNLQVAAQYNPKSSEYLGAAAYLTLGRAMSHRRMESLGSDNLPDDTRRYIQQTVTQLEDLAQDPDKSVAAGAEKNLGVLRMVLGDASDAVADMQRSVFLDPSREDAWDLLLGLQIQSASPEQLAAICESRLKYRDSARNRLLLARAYQHEEKWDLAADQAGQALKLEPDNVVAELELTALALKQSTDVNELAKVAVMMPELTRLVGALPPGMEAAKRRREVLLDMAIAGGLTNTEDGAKIAKVCLAMVLKDSPDDQSAKDIMGALN
jgi:tetratricopeptide (TPR) repeat protein